MCRLAPLLLLLLPLVQGSSNPGSNKFKCGIPKEAALSMISGGFEARENQWPWVVSLRKRDRDDSHICAGALIGPKFVITAAHCFSDEAGLRTASWSVMAVLGAHRLGRHWAAAEQRMRVRRLHFHPRYAAPGVRDWAFDLVLVELASAFRPADGVAPVCLPPSSAEPAERELCIVVGWGATGTADSSDALLQAEVPVVGRAECNSRRFWKQYVDDSMLCAGNTASKVSACQGDSGGPLFCPRGARGQVDQWAVYGVVSWGPQQCAAKPSVYANIAAELDWIKLTLNGAGEDVLVPQTAPIVRTTPRPRRSWQRQRATTSDWRRSWTTTRNWRSQYTTTTTRRPRPTTPRHRARPSKSSSRRSPPCDTSLLPICLSIPSWMIISCFSGQFERISQFYLYGPSPSDFIQHNVRKPSDCIRECCRRGPDDCQSVLYFPKYRQCRMRKIRRCDVEAAAGRGTAGHVNHLVVYLGKKCD